MVPPRQNAPAGRVSRPAMAGSIISDPRFSNIHTDPRFRLPSKKSTHVTIDKRFAHMLKDEDFTQKASVDRYGRKVAKDAGKRELERMYRVENGDEDGGKQDRRHVLEESSGTSTDDDDVETELARLDRKHDPARDGGFSSSDDDSDEDELDKGEFEEEDAFEFPTGGKEVEVEEMRDATSRLAIVNLDWDNIRATDLMAVATSFAPEGGRVLGVTVYPSDFGRERMEREELEGPPPEIFAKAKGDDSDSGLEEDSEDEEERIKRELLEEDKGDEFDSKALRRYQLERLRYYYAVVTADSAATGRHLYEQMDGREYLSTANFFDLRFVPDNVSFDEDSPRDTCSRIPDDYRPSEFTTDALTHSRVKLTWDADCNARKEMQKRAFSQQEIHENDLQAYIGSDSSSNNDDSDVNPEAGGTEVIKSAKSHVREDKAAKVRAALGLGSTHQKPRSADKLVGDMQITFTSALSSSKDDKDAVFENEPEETTKEKYIRKAREHKLRRKERAKARRMGLDAEATQSEKKTLTDPAVNGKDALSAGVLASQEADDPFNDPFFENPEQVRKQTLKHAKKADRRHKREKRDARAVEDAAERARLELLMVEDEGNSHMRHFDMNDIEKAETKGRRKSKKGKRGKEENAAQELDKEGQEGFQMDTQDPRFSALFESHEFAIDPTNPRFRDTKGMKALLEEGRRRRKIDSAGDGAVKRARKDADAHGNATTHDDVKRLVQRVKVKAEIGR